MIATRIIRRFDDMGRIVIPIAIREAIFGTKNVEGKAMEIFYEKDGTVILKPIEIEER